MTASTATAILSLLRDAHIPSAPGWWPPAFGWWVLFFTVTGTVGYTVFRYLKKRHQQRCPAWHALNELDTLWEDYDNTKDAKLLLKRLSSLMRRTAISLSSSNEVAALTGEDWLVWLDSHVPAALFTEGDGRLLADAPYIPHLSGQSVSDENIEAVFDACEEWLEHNVDKTPTRPISTRPAPGGGRATRSQNAISKVADD